MTIDKAPLLHLLFKQGFSHHDFFDHEFMLFQMGVLTPKKFFYNKSLQFGILPSCLAKAFNYMLKPNVKAILTKLNANYIFASNINQTHFEYFVRLMRPSTFSRRFSHLSYQVGYLKPSLEFFDFMKRLTTISALFIDDKQENLTVAEQFGVTTAHCETPEHLPIILKEFGAI